MVTAGATGGRLLRVRLALSVSVPLKLSVATTVQVMVSVLAANAELRVMLLPVPMVAPLLLMEESIIASWVGMMLMRPIGRLLRLIRVVN